MDIYTIYYDNGDYRDFENYVADSDEEARSAFDFENKENGGCWEIINVFPMCVKNYGYKLVKIKK